MVRRAALIATLLALSACSLAPVAQLKQRPLALRSTIVADDGTPIATVFDENRAAVKAKDVPEVMKQAMVAAEDGRFFAHAGVDAASLLRALIVDLSAGRARQGGSTITQQLAKMMFDSGGKRSLKTKLDEARLALHLEQTHSKQQIITMYLNRAYFGSGAYGLAAANETYFRTKLKKMSLRQAALLAGLVRAPAQLNPFRNPKGARERRSYVLRRMRDLGMVTEMQRRQAERSSLGLRKGPRVLHALRHPYFVNYVEQQVLADPTFGATRAERRATLTRGGLQIHTTLDARMQRAAERTVAETFDRASDPDAALIAIDPKTGEIKAMVGGRDFRKSQFNEAVQAHRQPGSAFKPFVLAAAIEAGISPEDRYDSSATVLHYGDGASWTVHNFDGHGYGHITLREGMVHSVNGVYARLVLDVGARNVAQLAHRAGITSPLDPYPSIALGALRTGVSPLEMASAYGTFAANGMHAPAHGILEAKDAEGNILYSDRSVEPDKAMDAGTAYTVTDVLRDVARRGTGTSANIGRPMGDKTGTTEEHRDAWLVGYTPDLVTAVWVGYRKPKPMNNVRGIKVVGASFPAHIWRTFMQQALKHTPERDFPIPEGGLVKVRVGGGGTCLSRYGTEVELPEPLVPTRECPRHRSSPSPSPSTAPKETKVPAPTKKRPRGK